MSLRESCGVFGAYSSSSDVFPYLYWGMVAQNHRGHQSYGFATYAGDIDAYSDLSLIPPLESKNGILRLLPGKAGIGNVRYATSGYSNQKSLQRDAMPIVERHKNLSVAISFNGNIVNIRSLKKIFGIDSTSSDARALCHLLMKNIEETGSIADSTKSCMEVVDGSFSVTGVTSEGTLFAFKDPLGIKPLCHGVSGSIEAFSSESVGLDINGLKLIEEIEPGELFTINEGYLSKEKLTNCKHKAFCAFEFAYFARPDSIFNHKYVYQARRDFGSNLAFRFADVASRCDVVFSLPETANDATYGFHEKSGLPWDMATRRHRYVTQRAFITGVETRKSVVFRKVNILGSRVRGKKIAVIDDSIVRGDTTRSTVKRLRAAGAREIHLFITFPRIIGPCFYGIDMATYTELIGSWKGPEEIAEEVDADTVNYQPIEDYVEATGMKRNQLCLGCITGCYPTPMAEKMANEMRESLTKGTGEKGRIYETI